MRINGALEPMFVSVLINGIPLKGIGGIRGVALQKVLAIHMKFDPHTPAACPSDSFNGEVRAFRTKQPPS
jgi:hypothetical protein